MNENAYPLTDCSPENTLGIETDYIEDLNDVKLPVVHSLLKKTSRFPSLKRTSNEMDFSHERSREIEAHQQTSNFDKKSSCNVSSPFLWMKCKERLKLVTYKSIVPLFFGERDSNIVNDLSFFFNIWKKGDNNKEENNNNLNKYLTKSFCFEKFLKQFFYYFNLLPVFKNSSGFIILWSIIQLFFILMFFFAIPLEICFNIKLAQEYIIFSYIETISVYFFFVDILINLNTSVYIKGELIHDRKQIFKHYIHTLFIIDMISIFSIFLELNYDENLNGFSASLVRSLILLKMFNFSIIIKKLKEMFYVNQWLQNILSLFSLIFRIILFSHLFACVWYYIGTVNIEISWISKYDLLSKSWITKYLYSYYYVCVTMNTVGYGDISPQNSLERLFAIIFIYIACGIFAYSITCIGRIVNEIAKTDNEFQKDLNVINGFLNHKKINFDLRMRIRKYFEYMWYEEKVEKLEEEARIFNKLSGSLKEELLLEANGSILRDLKMFSLNFSEELLRNTIPLLKEVIFQPGDLIFLKGDCENKDLYIIRKGKIEIFVETNKKNFPQTILKTLEKGETFGEISFFSSQERSACARSTDFTSVYMIKHEDFLNLLKNEEKDYQKFYEIKDRINIYDDYSGIYIKCYSCKTSSHLINKCPNLSYQPIKEIALKKHFFSTTQTRKPGIVRRKIRFHSKKDMEIIKKKAFIIQNME